MTIGDALTALVQLSIASEKIATALRDAQEQGIDEVLVELDESEQALLDEIKRRKS